MNNFTTETGGVNTYLVYEIPEDAEIDTLSMGMVVNNKIRGVMPMVFTQIDNKKYLKYNISSKISLDQYFGGVVNKKRLLTVFSSILSAIIDSTEYMIEPSSFLFELENIYVDVTSSEAYLLCLPLMECANRDNIDVGMFFKNIVFSTQFDQTENTDYVAKMISYLNSAAAISLEELKKMIDDMLLGPIKQPATPRPQPVQPQPQPQVQQPVVQVAPQPQSATPAPQVSAPKPQPQPQPQPQAKAPAAPAKSGLGIAIPGAAPKEQPEKPVEQKEKKGFSLFGNRKKDKKQEEKSAPVNTGFAVPGRPATPAKPAVQQAAPVSQPNPVQQYVGKAANFGETTVLGGASAGETTVLGAGSAAAPQPYLLRRKNKEKISLCKEVFRIGKEKSFVDYFIGDNTAISRSHANIVCRNAEYFVVDTNSTNHTYINGAMLQSSVETKLSHGDVIRLANEDFEFFAY